MDVCTGEVLHRGYGGFTGVIGAAHGVDFVNVFDGTRFFGDFFAVFQGEAWGLKRVCAVQHYFVNSEQFVVASVLLYQNTNLVGELVCDGFCFVAS